LIIRSRFVNQKIKKAIENNQQLLIY
jgi:hypothetical protein